MERTDMEKADRPIMEKNYIERLNAEIERVLEILKGTTWKDVDGSFSNYVNDGLKQLGHAFLELNNQNIPLPQVKQAQVDIAKAITEAKIIPNICGVLTYLYKANLNLSDSHKYDDISSMATRILCNYASAAEFANVVANCPGFLEFICEQLRDSSENYLQIVTQETKLKDRIDVFIKIVGNISYSPKNIPRLRTCNFTAALEPYLKANDGVILNTTINTLTRITIGELFETKGITSEGTPSSQPAAPNWQTVVKRVTGLISNELKDLHDIEWKEENGAYTTEIFKSLRLIQTVYYALETRNAPAANVKQSRKDIASILIDANIVPKIYGMLTDLHLHTLEITDSERNEMLSSDAQSILCNYANASDGFAEHVANIPGFLEFISAKLTSASEEYLQLDKKETKLKDRIVGFIKIAQNISVFPTNIPRLRTLNFTAALEPYLKTNNSDVLDSTINILTWIKIGEVLDTNWVTSEDAPSSQSAAPNWQTAVERVTGLISNELKDLHDIEWKEENGAYKIKILMSFKLIRYVYFALETRNAPVVYVKQFRKDIASVLIDANIIPKICGVFTDLHHHTLEITDNKISKILSSDAQSIILCNTYSSMEFAEYVANVSGFLEFIMAKLASEGKRHLHLDNEDSLKEDAKVDNVVIVHNISKSDSCRTRLRRIETIDVLKPFLLSTDSDIQSSALAALAAITNEEECEIIKSNEQSVTVLLDRFRQGLQSVIRRSTGKKPWSCEECALTIRTLARNDANKKLLVQLGALELLVELSKGDEDEQTAAVRALWDLSFDEENRKKMMNEEKLELISVLDKMKASDNKLISEAAYGTLWNLRDLLQNSKLERFQNIAKTMMTARESSPTRELKPEGHIMISYQKSHQKTLLMIKEELVKKGLKVWMDVDLMAGSILQATAEAVENADIVLICLSNEYKNSKSCRREERIFIRKAEAGPYLSFDYKSLISDPIISEVEYADRLDKMIVPLQLEEGYRPDGWLGLIAGGLKSYDFSGHRPIQSELNGLLSALRKMKDELHSDPKENNMQYAERSRSGDSTDLENVPIDGATFALDAEISPGNINGAVGGTPISPMKIDDSCAGDADSASLASIESSSDDADMIEDAVEPVDIAAGPITQEHINQARLCNVIVTLCADVLRDILLSQVPGGFTNIYKTLLGSRTTIVAMKQIGQEQLNRIFPDPRFRYTGTVDQFDITLLYALIRSISSCPAPISGWGRQPTDQPRDVSLSANVERIRLLRNNVSGHSVDGKLDDQACEDYFRDIGQILNDVEAVLGDKGYKDALEARRKQIITPQEAKINKHQLIEGMKAIMETFEAMGEKVKQLSTTIAQNW